MAEVVSLGDRLKLRRAELGLSQAQAARELDVARTAYRLWEMEAAKPSPDRWRLISRWLGISVTTMLLADQLISDDEAAAGGTVEVGLGRLGRDWEVAGGRSGDDFFHQGRALIQNGVASRSITPEQADELSAVLDRLEQQRQTEPTIEWAPGELRKAFRASPQTPRAARAAVHLVAGDIPSETLEAALLLTSELVTNSVVHGPPAPAIVDVYIGVGRDAIRIEVADEADSPPLLGPPGDCGGYGLTLVDALAARWDTGRDGDRNITWFEIDLPAPGA